MARQRWASRTAFLLAAIGSAVGLGNVWRFPYLAYEFGGGAFLIPYLIALFVIGIPLLMLEFAIGQKVQAGAVKTFQHLHGRWGGLGIFALLSAFIIVTYYAVVMAWSLIYFVSSFSGKWFGNSEGFFFNEVLHISSGVGEVGGINWMILAALSVVWILIYFSVWKGVRSVGKVVWWTVPIPVVLLGILLVRGVTLPGFLEGWAYYISPDWSIFLDFKRLALVLHAAVSQIFFTLTLGFGVMIAYASYNKKNENTRGDTYITALTNSAISLFAGFVVFAIIGIMALSKGVGVSEVVTSGPGLAFVVFPEALSLMPFAELFSAVFFVILLTLGIDSAFSLVEAINAAVKDTARGRRWGTERISLVVCFVALVLGIIYTTNAGLYFLDIVDHFVTNFNLVIVGLLQAVLVGWIYGANKIRDYINSVSKSRVSVLWDISIKFIIPISLIALLVYQFYVEITVPYEGYPGWALAIGWFVVIIPVLIFVGSLFKKPSAS